MKNLLITSLVFLFIPLFGKNHFPETFGSPYVQWSAIFIVIVTVSVGFAKSISDYFTEGEKKTSALLSSIGFLFIFCFLVASHLPVYQIRNVLPEKPEFFSETEVLNALTTGKTIEDRRKMALLVYFETGKKVPYLETADSYRILNPKLEEIKIFEQSLKVRNKTKYLKQQIVKLSQETTYIQTMELLLFWVVVSSTLLIDRKKIKKQPTVKDRS